MKDGFAMSTYRASDRDDVVRIWQSSLHSPGQWNEPIAAIARQQAAQPNGFLVGRIQGRVVATCVVGYDGVRGWLYRLAVDPEHRGQGYGRKIVERAEDYLRKLGCPKINLQVRGENDGVVNFYKRLGYYIQDHTSIAKILCDGETVNTMAEQGAVEMVVDEDIRVTEFRASDKGTLIRVLSASDVYAENLLAMPFPYTASDADAWLDLASRMRLPKSSARSWAIRTADGDLIGSCGFKEIRAEHCAEVGYWMAQSHWNKGITTRVVARLCDYGFQDMNLVRITAQTLPHNHASARVLEKNGFVAEGTLRAHLRKGDAFLDSRLFARLRDDVA
jgi:RimJ/RimL family protein N-acetyltransferase